MHLLRQSTAATVTVGPVLDSTGAAVTTAVVGDFKISKNGTSSTLSGATVTHDANGYYNIALTTGNTDTTGRFVIYSGNTSHSMGSHRFTVLLPSVFDALIANATNTTGGLPTATGAISALAGAISTFNRSTETVTVGTNNDKTGYSLTQAFPANFASLAITVGGAVTAGTVSDKSGYSLTQSFPANFASMSIDASGRVLLQPTQTGVTIPTVTNLTNGVTVSDKTGFSLASNGLASVTSWTVNITGNLSGSVGSVTGNVGGNVTGSVGSIAGVTFPTGFGTWTAPLTTSGTASAVWDALIASYTVANSFGARVLRTDHASAGNAAKVTGAGHVAADIHELQPAVIDNTHFAAGAIDANAIAANAIGASELAADAVSEIVAGMATQPQLVDLATMIVNDGTANARFSTSALQNAPTGGGGSATVNVLPYTGAVPDRVEGTTIKVFYNELTNVSVGVTDATGAAVTLDAKTLRFCVEDRYGVDVLTLNDGDITRSGSTFTVQIPQSLTDTVGANYRWSLRDLTGSLNTVLIHGQMIVAEAAEDEA